MSKMTKAQARKRLEEARKKIDTVAFGAAARHLSSAQRNKLYGFSNHLITLIKAMK